EALTRQGPPSAPIPDWVAFLQEGFNSSAIHRAVEEAVKELDGAGPSRRGSTIEWSSASTVSLTRMPEALARLRTSLASPQSKAPADASSIAPADRVALLTDAFDLLGRICVEAQKFTRLPLTVEPAH